MNKKIWLIIPILLLGAACQKSQRVTEPPFQDTVIVPGQGSSTDLVTYQGKQGQTALDLLKAKYPGKIQTKTSAFGEYVEAISGLKPDNNHFWTFYVNDQLSTTTAAAFVTKNSDIIVWKIVDK